MDQTDNKRKKKRKKNSEEVTLGKFWVEIKIERN